MQSGDREPLEGIAEEPSTEGSTATTNAATFAQELLDYSQELEELYSASESLGDTAPMTPVLFDHGVDAVSGTKVLNPELALRCVSQGANFRQIRGVRRLTLLR